MNTEQLTFTILQKRPIKIDKSAISKAQKNRLIALIIYFLKFQAQAAISEFIESPIEPFKKFLDNLKSDFR